MPELLRHIRLDELKDRPYELKLWESEIPDSRNNGRYCLAYEFSGPDGILFEGNGFGSSPCHAIDSDETVRALLGFLTLKPGDTDSDYFRDYTAAQIAFAEGDAEYLQLYTMDPEEGEEAYQWVNLDEWES